MVIKVSGIGKILTTDFTQLELLFVVYAIKNNEYIINIKHYKLYRNLRTAEFTGGGFLSAMYSEKKSVYISE